MHQTDSSQSFSKDTSNLEFSIVKVSTIVNFNVFNKRTFFNVQLGPLSHGIDPAGFKQPLKNSSLPFNSLIYHHLIFLSFGSITDLPTLSDSAESSLKMKPIVLRTDEHILKIFLIFETSST